RSGLRPHVVIDRLTNGRADPVRTGRHARDAIVHQLGDRSLAPLAVAEGFEPSGEFPLHTLSRRVPSAARAGHRAGVYGTAEAALGALEPQERRVGLPALRREVHLVVEPIAVAARVLEPVDQMGVGMPSGARAQPLV